MILVDFKALQSRFVAVKAKEKEANVGLNFVAKSSDSITKSLLK